MRPSRRALRLFQRQVWPSVSDRGWFDLRSRRRPARAAGRARRRWRTASLLRMEPRSAPTPGMPQVAQAGLRKHCQRRAD
jgi:hypothetical protein